MADLTFREHHARPLNPRELCFITSAKLSEAKIMIKSKTDHIIHRIGVLIWYKKENWKASLERLIELGQRTLKMHLLPSTRISDWIVFILRIKNPTIIYLYQVLRSLNEMEVTIRDYPILSLLGGAEVLTETRSVTLYEGDHLPGDCLRIEKRMEEILISEFYNQERVSLSDNLKKNQELIGLISEFTAAPFFHFSKRKLGHVFCLKKLFPDDFAFDEESIFPLDTLKNVSLFIKSSRNHINKCNNCETLEEVIECQTLNSVGQGEE